MKQKKNKDEKYRTKLEPQVRRHMDFKITTLKQMFFCLCVITVI